MSLVHLNKILDKKIIKPVIIPEIGINHFGSLSLAKKIVLKAKKAGATCIKAQVHLPEMEMSQEAKIIKPGNSNKSIYNVIKQNCLSLDEELKLKKYIENLGMLYIASSFCFEAAEFLNKIGTKVFKIGSGEASNFPFIEKIVSFKKPILISVGMHSLDEIRKTYSFLKKKKARFILNHCVNMYPTPIKNSNLNKFIKLKKILKCPIGLSDHTEGLATAYLSMGIGTALIEKHFVINKKKSGPDISSSIDFGELKQLISNTNHLDMSIYKKNGVLPGEKVTRKFAFHSIVSKKNIIKGEIISEKNITIKRPGTGFFKANDFFKVLGKKAKSDIKKNIQIKKKHI